MRWKRAMKLDDYPPQEPLSDAGTAYGAECWRRSARALPARSSHSAPIPYQRLLVFARATPRWPRAAVLAWRRLDVGLQGMDAVHGAGLHRRRRDVRLRGLPARAAARVSRGRSTTAFAPSLGSGAMSPRHGGDPQQLFIGGHSAGGHYAALLAVDDALAEATSALPRSVVRGCLPLSAVFEFGAGSGLSMRPRFLGADPASETRASPLSRLVAAAAAVSRRVRHARLSAPDRAGRAIRGSAARSSVRTPRSCSLPSARISPRATPAANPTVRGCRRRSPSWQSIAADRRRDAALATGEIDDHR